MSAGVRSVTVRVPASTANLGSGYDSFGLALSLHNVVTAHLVDRAEGFSVKVEGEGAGQVSLGRDNLVASSMRRLFERAGRADIAARVECRNAIPFGRGLGSSSAAIVGGLVAANALLDAPLAAEELFAMAAAIEGHPDNVAAALAGGFTICWSEAGQSRFAHVDPPGGIAGVIVVREQALSTKVARGLLPANVPHVDAAFDAGRAGLLATGIVLGIGELLGPGMNDRLHEQYRAAAVPDLEPIREALLSAGADGAALSGAGPTVIGLIAGTDDESALRRAGTVAANATTLLAGMPGRREPEAIGLDRQGAVIVEG